VRRAWPRFLVSILISGGAVGATVTALPASARANEWTQIASAFDDANALDIFVGVDYAFKARRAAIKRELSGATGTGAAPDTIPIVKDLAFSEDRHVITPHLELGIFHDVQLGVALPITVALSRSYEFDQRSDPCVFPGAGGPTTCVDRTNSSTLIDKLLPDGTDGKIGYDANDPTTNFDLNSKTVFRSVGRAGLDQVHLNLSWAPMNQARDDTQPTWILTAELRLSVGKIMRFNRLDPQSQTGVSTGVHEFRAQTSVSKRTSWAEPFVVFWWQAPIAVRGDKPNDPDGSLFWDVGFGQKAKMPQQHAGTIFGFDATLLENPQEKQRLSLELVGTIEAHFSGLGYSEMWEPFAFAGDATAATHPLAVQLDPTKADAPFVSHPGVSTIENYMTFAGRVGLNGELGPHAKFNVAFELGHDQTHAISYTDAGMVFPTCGPTHPGPSCEASSDLVVTPGTAEVNPLHKQIIDIVGRRYIVDESTVYSLFVSGQLLF
jgi:hypothetical protein